jgi:hypothetical protein
MNESTTKADYTSKDEVMIQRVIREVGGGTSYPALTKTNYSDWAHLMKVKLKAWVLWSIIEDDGADQEEDMIVLDALCDAIPSAMVPMIVKKDTAKEAWDMIATMRVGDNCVKKATTQQLRQKFDLAMFKDGVTVEDYVLRLSGMTAHLTMFSEEVEDSEIIGKML